MASFSSWVHLMLRSGHAEARSSAWCARAGPCGSVWEKPMGEGGLGP